MTDTARDPVFRLLGGCALVVAGLAAIVIVVGLIVGWNLTRDESPERPEEAFLLGDETRYWCFDLKPDDAGLVAVNDKLGASAEAARDEALANSPLRFLPLGHRRNQLGEVLPLKIELALAPDGWSGRVTFTKGVLRMRAMVKVFRWLLGRSSKEAVLRSEGGVAVTTLHDKRGSQFAMATVGNRLLLANGSSRLERALALDRPGGVPPDTLVADLHAAVRLPGEDAWAFDARSEVASLDVDPNDALVFRIVVPARDAMSSEEAMAIARGFLPYVAEEAIRIDEDYPRPGEDGRWLVAGRIPDLSRGLAAAFLRFSASRAEGAPWPQSPSAIPPPPSPPTSSDPRSGTPAAPPRGGTPSPVR